MKEYIGKKEAEIFNVILDELGDRDYVKFKSQKKGYMALNVDNLGKLTLDGEVHKLISMSHNRKQNGDLMADPDMQFAISQQGVVIPITFQNDFTGSYDIAIIDGNQINERKAEKLAEFTNIWLNNLNAQQGILEHKYSLVDVEGNAIDSKFKQNFAFLDDDTFPQELEIQKISITNDVKKVAKGDDYPEYFANFTQGEKGLFNFGVFAAQNGISPATVAKFLKATSGRGSKSNKEGIAEAIDSLVKEINLISSKDIEKEFKRRTGFTPDEGKKLLEYENINELLQAHIWENTLTLHKNMDENHPAHDYDFQSITKIQKQENTMPSADYTKRQNETNGGAYSRTKNNYNANYGNYGARQNHAQQEQGGFTQTTQNTATQTATAPQKAEQNDYKSRQQYASKSYKSPKTQNTEQPKTEKPKSFELAKQDKLEVDEAIKSLQKALKDPKTKEKAQIALMSYLSQFNDLHNYTARNIALAQKQAKERGMDNVSHLASFDTWKKMKGTEKDENGEFKSVSVLKGEKGLSILVPQFKPRFLEQRDIDKNAKNPFALVLDENGQKQPVMTKTKNEKGEIVEVQKQELAYFTQGKVFDISQTNAFEIGAIKKLEKAKVGEFDGQITDFTLQTIASKITEKYGFEVNFAPLNRGARGYCSEKDGKIEIFIDNRHLSEASQLATLFHELGHAVLNHTSKSKEDSNTKEVQAETFAFVLSNKFGLETTSAEYISAYLADTDKFFEVVEPVRKAVGKAYDKLDLQTEFESLVSAKEAYYENAEFKNNAEDQRLEKGQLYSFEINTNNIDPDDSTDMKQLRAEHKPQVAEQDTQRDDSHRSDNKQRNKNRP